MAVQMEGQGRHGHFLLFCDTFNHEQNEVKCLLKCLESLLLWFSGLEVDILSQMRV
jgi:hypothetical protein